MALSSKKIEEIAVNRICSIFYKSGRIDPIIAQNDKEPVWDGHLYIKSKDEHKRVAVQVKGKTRIKIPRKPSYPISVVNLNNYMRDGGVIFFVVYIIGDAYDPYYATLTPIDAKRYIRDANGHKDISVKLLPVPDSLTKFENIIIEFYADCKRQVSFIDRKPMTLKEVNEHKYNIHAYARAHSKRDLLKKLVERPRFLYAQLDFGEHTIDYPIGDGPFTISYAKIFSENVDVNGQTYFRKFSMEAKNSTFRIIVGGSITYEFDVSTLKGRSTYESKATFLSERLNELHFLQATYAHKKFKVGQFNIVVNTVKKNDIINLRKEIAFWERIQTLFHRFNVDDNINIKDITEEDFTKINLLIKAVIDKQEIKYDYKLDRFCSINILNYKFFVIADNTTGYMYKISNFFENGMKLTYTCKDDQGNTSLTSPFTLVFQRPDFTTYSNMRYEDILPSYQNIVQYSSSIYEIARLDLLNALNAYDAMEQKSPRLYETIEALADWILNNSRDNKIIETMDTINTFQIIKRKRDLTAEEKRILVDFLSIPDIPSNVETAIHILLDNKTQSEICYDKLTKEEKKLFMSWPISFFMKKY